MGKEKEVQRLLEEFGEHIIVSGITGSGKSFLLHEANIRDSKYYDFVEITPDFPCSYMCSLNDNNFNEINSAYNFLEASERTLILDFVEIADGFNQSNIINFIKVARKYGKRLIIVTYPSHAEKIKWLFGAVITMSRFNNEVTFDVEMINGSR